MKLANSIKELHHIIKAVRREGDSIGFVPTMGALHNGHLALVKRSKLENNICVCSIFVNPTQFNNPEDLKKYPRQMEQDIRLLESVNCDIVFIPETEEMYPNGEPEILFHFGELEKVMEGADRPGHFQGVGTIVKKLFDIVEPHRAYFGNKDYQQLLIIKSLTQQYKLSPKIIGCDIVRENDGLAMSSRNQRLSSIQRSEAPHIYSVLKAAKQQQLDVESLKLWVAQKINTNSLMELSYFEISDAETLKSIIKWDKNQRAMGFIVVNMGEIRLIDNIELNI